MPSPEPHRKPSPAGSAESVGWRLSLWDKSYLIENKLSVKETRPWPERGPLRAAGQLRRPRAQSIAGPWPLRAPRTSCDWHKRPRRITRAAARHKGLSEQTQSKLSRLSSVKRRRRRRGWKDVDTDKCEVLGKGGSTHLCRVLKSERLCTSAAHPH